MIVCCDGCRDPDCDGIGDQAVERVTEWLARKKYSPSGVSREVVAAIEEMVADMKDEDA